MVKAYITGAKGFLGTNLTKKLSDYITIPHEKISSVKLDNFEKFFFLSAYGNMSYQTEDDLILKANITDLINILLQVNWKTTKSFVFVSTSSVKLPIQTMYSRTKRAAEEILLSFAEKYKAPICIVRPFSVTGVGEQPAHLIPRLIESCTKGEKIEFISTPRHDFIDVKDVVDGIIALSDSGARGIYELGSGKSYSNEEVKEIVEKVTEKKANIIPGTGRPYDTTDWCSYNYKARGYGWMPGIKLEESIREMVKNYERA